MNFEKPSKQSRVAPSPQASTRRKSPAYSPRSTRCGLSLKSTGSADSRGTTGHHPGLGLILILLTTLLLGAGAVGLVRSALDRPDVYTSYLTQKCVKVINADGTPGSCDKVPEKYNNIWVE